MKQSDTTPELTAEEFFRQFDDDSTDWIALDYSAVVTYQGKRVLVTIDNDPGGGFESGYESVYFMAPLTTNNTDLRFAIHHEGFMDELGKFFGMQDIKTGYEDFDKKVIVKGNNEKLIKSLFKGQADRKVFEHLNDFKLFLHEREDENSPVKRLYLEFDIYDSISDTVQLKEIFYAYCDVLSRLEALITTV
jgi:hypothetical protein